MNKLVVILIISAFLHIPICSGSEVSHPPTFEQIIDASNEKTGCASAIYEALKYTDNDVNKLIQQNDYNYIIGAAYQYDKPKTISFLKDYFPLIENDPTGLSLFISCALQEYEQALNLKLEHLTQRLITIDPENSYAYYLKAYYFSRANDVDKCLTYVRKANSKNIFKNYFSDLSNISIKTSLFLGYSKFTAQSYALGLQHDIMIFSGLSKYLTQKSLEPELQVECLKMGIMLKRNSKTLLNNFMAYAIQLRALKEMKGKENEVKIIEQEKSDSIKILEMAHAIEETYDIPENRQVEYFNDLYSKSETYAILNLSKEYPINTE